MDSLWCLSCVDYILPTLSPSPGSEASLGNSLNTSEEELHTAGITLAPKGTTHSRQPISIQIAPPTPRPHLLIQCDHYRFCSDHYHSTTHTQKKNTLSTFGWGLFCFKTTKPPATVTFGSPSTPAKKKKKPPPGGLVVPLWRMRAQVCFRNATDHLYISIVENK